MNLKNAFCILTGILMLAGSALGCWVHPGWLLLPALAGLDLLLSAFTGFSLLESILRKLGAGAGPARKGR
jgi:hypothetical protein